MKFILAFVFSGLSLLLLAQTPQAIVAEHFTNTRCSICASRNPAFNATLSQHPEVLRLTFHPSAPYSNCYFSQQNPTENDDRVKWYQAYGGTPQLVLQGKRRTNNNPLLPDSAIANAAGKTTFLELRLSLTQVSATDFAARVKIFRTAAGDAGNLLLFACISETEIAYNAPNGETLHRNVFLKGLTPMQGQALAIGDSVGDSTSVTVFFQKNAAWGQDLELTAMVQQGTSRSLVQAGRTTEIIAVNAVDPAFLGGLVVYPNPVADVIRFRAGTAGSCRLLAADGRELLTSTFLPGETSLEVAQLPAGQYYLRVSSGQEEKTVVVQKD